MQLWKARTLGTESCTMSQTGGSLLLLTGTWFKLLAG